MVLPPSGPISLNDIAGEFGSDLPDDNIEEYYRGGPFVTENNTNVPACSTGDCEVSLDDYYNGELIISKSISSDTSQLNLSELFTVSEWTSTAKKRVVIETGVTVYSADANVVACRTGSLVQSQSMNGTLTLVIDGYIYGAPGSAGIAAAGGNGGNAFQADISCLVENNSRIWAGGGGGGAGGNGRSVRYYPQDITYKYNVDFNDFWRYDKVCWLINLGLDTGDVYWYHAYDTAQTSPASTTEFTSGGYRYQRGDYVESYLQRLYYKARRCYDTTQPGSLGGNGGNGQGYNQTRTSGAVSVFAGTAESGGYGGGGGDWGVNGTAGNNPYGFNTTTMIEMAAGTSSFSGGTAGIGVIGNSNITWSGTGTIKGAIT